MSDGPRFRIFEWSGKYAVRIEIPTGRILSNCTMELSIIDRSGLPSYDAAEEFVLGAIKRFKEALT